MISVNQQTRMSWSDQSGWLMNDEVKNIEKIWKIEMVPQREVANIDQLLE